MGRLDFYFAGSGEFRRGQGRSEESRSGQGSPGVVRKCQVRGSGPFHSWGGGGRG